MSFIETLWRGDNEEIPFKKTFSVVIRLPIFQLLFYCFVAGAPTGGNGKAIYPCISSRSRSDAGVYLDACITSRYLRKKLDEQGKWSGFYGIIIKSKAVNHGKQIIDWSMEAFMGKYSGLSGLERRYYLSGHRLMKWTIWYWHAFPILNWMVSAGYRMEIPLYLEELSENFCRKKGRKNSKPRPRSWRIYQSS